MQHLDLSDPVFSDLYTRRTPYHPDLHRLWAKHFQPAGKPDCTVQIPMGWASFLTVKLLDPTKFQ